MSHDIKTIKSNTKKLLKMAADELADEIHFFRETAKLEESAFKADSTGHNPGDTVSIRVPTEWLVQEDDFDISAAHKDAKETVVNMSLDKSATVPFSLNTNELATDIDVGAVYKRLIRPAVLSLATNAESRLLTAATQYVGNTVGTAGSTIMDPDTVMYAGEMLDEFLAPMNERCLLMDAKSMRSAVNANKNLFTFERKEATKAYIGDLWNASWFKNQLIYNHTNGNDVTGVAVEADVVTIANGMTTLGVDGLTANTGTITKGTVFTINGCYAVHPKTKATLPFLKQFTHVGDTVTANASGQATITLNEPIYYTTTDSRQNVSAAPTDEGALVFTGSASTSYRQSLLWNKEAFRVVSVPLYIPPSGIVLGEQVSESGINLALIQYFDGDTRKLVTRLDALFGVVAVRPTHACRITA